MSVSKLHRSKDVCTKGEDTHVVGGKNNINKCFHNIQIEQAILCSIVVIPVCTDIQNIHVAERQDVYLPKQDPNKYKIQPLHYS